VIDPAGHLYGPLKAGDFQSLDFDPKRVILSDR